MNLRLVHLKLKRLFGFAFFGFAQLEFNKLILMQKHVKHVVTVVFDSLLHLHCFVTALFSCGLRIDPRVQILFNQLASVDPITWKPQQSIFIRYHSNEGEYSEPSLPENSAEPFSPNEGGYFVLSLIKQDEWDKAEFLPRLSWSQITKVATKNDYSAKEKQSYSDLLRHELQKRLLVRLFQVLCLDVEREVILNKVDRFGQNFAMASATVLDTFADFADLFEKKHLLAFFEYSQADVRKFCKDFCQVEDSEKQQFQTIQQVLAKTQKPGQSSSLTSKHAVIKKTNGHPKKSLFTTSNSNNEQRTSAMRNLGRFENFRNRFLEYLSEQIDSAYNEDFLKNLYENLVSKSSSLEGESVLGNFTSNF